MLLITVLLMVTLGLPAGARRLHIRGVEDCPHRCICAGRNVYCDRKGLTQIPARIPSSARQLKLDGNQFTDTVITKSNLTGLVALEHLYLSRCGLTAIEIYAFSDMSNLRWLDLTNNQLFYLGRGTFQGLRLQQLFLGANRGLELHPEAFTGFSTDGLDLHECALGQVQPDLFNPLNGTLQNLWLDSNELRTVDRRLEPFFKSLSHLRLAGNPLHCNCQLRWLHLLYLQAPPGYGGTIMPTCFSPPFLRGKSFVDLSADTMLCVPPSFGDIDAVLDPGRAFVRCQAEGDPAPDLYWVSPTGPIQHAPAESPQAPRTVATLNLTDTGEVSGQYFCIADNSVGRRTFTFNVTWNRDADRESFPTQGYKPTSSIASRTPNPQTPTPTPHPIYLSSEPIPTRINTAGGKESHHEQGNRRGYYTLRELILAVLGTFAGTLLLCLILTRVYIQRRQSREGSCTSLEKPPIEHEALYQPPPQPLLPSTQSDYHAVNLQDYLIKTEPPTLPRR